MITPSSIEEVRELLRAAHDNSTPAPAFDLSRMDALIAHSPEDMTATAQTGMSLREFQESVGRAGQWLPLDPDAGEDLSLREILERNLAGPRRFGYGTARDYVIGMSVVLADGRLIKAGGNVVKNVAGYDLCKLFIGSGGSLGVVVEANFKLRPRSERAVVLQHLSGQLRSAGLLIEKILQSPLMPVSLDLCSAPEGHKLLLGLEGAAADVEYQLRLAAEFGITEPAEETKQMLFAAGPPPRRMSVLPSDVIPTLERLQPANYAARAGNGIIYFQGGSPLPPPMQLGDLMNRVKHAYDPKGILPEFHP